MFKFVFDLVTDPLGLPIEWYYEWIILVIIREKAYPIAFDKVGRLYHSGFISGGIAGSFVHWIIRAFWFIVMWAATYGIILIGKFIISHKVEVWIGTGFVIVVAIVIKLLTWNNEQKELARVKVIIKEDKNR